MSDPAAAPVPSAPDAVPAVAAAAAPAAVATETATPAANSGLELGEVAALREAVGAATTAYETAVAPLPSDISSEVRLGRFLDAYDHDQAAAAKAYIDMLAWRQEMGVDKLRESHMEAELPRLEQSALPHWEEVRACGEFGPWYVAGRSHEGDLVHLEVIGKADPSLLLEKVPQQKILEHYIAFFEVRSKRIDDLSVEAGRLVKFVQVRDLSQFGLSALRHANAMKLLRSVMKLGSANYPESSSKVIFVNTPTSFMAVWTAASMVLRKKTLDKVSFYKSAYHLELLKIVGPRVLHRLEKMQHLDDHDFISKGDEEDHLPLQVQRDVVVPAGKSAYFPTWMTRTGPRSSAKIVISPTSEQAGVPEFELVFAAAQRTEPKGEVVVSENKLVADAYKTDTPGCYQVTFPEMLPVDDGFLLVKFQNAAWVYSITVPVACTFQGDTSG